MAALNLALALSTLRRKKDFVHSDTLSAEEVKIQYKVSLY
jgi:hypothetical protein